MVRLLSLGEHHGREEDGEDEGAHEEDIEREREEAEPFLDQLLGEAEDEERDEAETGPVEEKEQGHGKTPFLEGDVGEIGRGKESGRMKVELLGR